MFKIESKDGREAKTVEYFGHSFVIPEYYSYIATDEMGDVFCYTETPVVNERDGVWQSKSACNVALGSVEYIGDWKDSLMKIE